MTTEISITNVPGNTCKLVLKGKDMEIETHIMEIRLREFKEEFDEVMDEIE